MTLCMDRKTQLSGPKSGLSTVECARPKRGLTQEELSDDELLRRHLAGCEQSLGHLIRRHEHSLRWVIRAAGVMTADHYDVLQEGALRMHRFARKFQWESSVYTWMVTIVRNTARSHVESEKKLASHHVVDFHVLHELEFSGIGTAYESLRPGASSERWEERLDLRHYLRGLDPELREVMALTVMWGYSVREAAAALKIPAGTVKSRKHRACRQLEFWLRRGDYRGHAHRTGEDSARTEYRQRAAG